VHGDEYDGIRACQDLAREIDPKKLAGSIVVVPVANPFAFAAARRRTPEDDVDLNRVFPGRPDGTLSQRLAHRLLTGVLDRVDFVFSLHGATEDGALTPWIEFLNEPGSVGPAAYAAALASGFPDLVGLPLNLPGRLLTALAERGIPVIEGEVGGRGQLQRQNVDYYKERVLAVAGHLGVLKTLRASPLVTPRIWALAANHVVAPVDGIFEREVELKQPLRAGDQVGRILDAAGVTAAELFAPEDSVVAGYREHAGARTGDTLVTLWTRTALRVG
jgi:predicted deacylase